MSDEAESEGGCIEGSRNKLGIMNRIHGEKYLWQLPENEAALVFDLAQKFNLSLPIAQTLLSRGMTDHDQLDRFLFTSYERDVAHPSLLKDIDKAVDRIRLAIEKKERILVFGDYDVDGITATSLMMLALLPLGAQINFYLPHRLRDGYGLSSKIVERAAQNKYSLIITVDNGITAFDAVEAAHKHNVDVIITDHHRPHGKIPSAHAIVNPVQEGCSYPFKKLAGVGVVFKLLSYLYEQKGLQLPPKAYELLTLGTVADVVPLIGENRYWVRHGLSLINAYESIPLETLKRNAKIARPRLRSTDIGYFIAPQLNALGRLEDPRQGVSFLIGSDKGEIERLGTVLFELNQARKTIEKSVFGQVVEQIQQGLIDLSSENIILAASSSWPPGVIGLVASRLVSAYGKPTLLFHLTKNGLAKGSCRSISEFNMFDALTVSGDLLESFGGHSAAAGLSLKVENLPLLKEKLEELIAAQLTAEDLQQKIILDAELKMADVGQKLLADIQHLEPFGHENKQPLFYLRNISLVEKPQLLKDEHVKCKVFADGVIKPLIFFGRPDLFPLLMKQEEKSFDAAVQISENYWNGRVNVELQGYDISFP